MKPKNTMKRKSRKSDSPVRPFLELTKEERDALTGQQLLKSAQQSLNAIGRKLREINRLPDGDERKRKFFEG